jgi:hypothetical protein
MAKIKCICKICGNYIGEYYPSVIRDTCSKECYKKLVSRMVSGKKNPNYRHGKCIENRCKNCGTLIDPRSTYCQKCGCGHTKGYRHTYEARQLIGRKSREKWTPDFKNKFKLTMIKRGHWIDPRNKEPYLIYRELSDWKYKMWDLLDQESLEKLKKYGIFNIQNNRNGCVRDHMYSRKSGFINGVFPIILRHPANCQCLTFSENISKAQKNKSKVDNQLEFKDDVISLEELFNRIYSFNKEWKEQSQCIELIEKYKSGERFCIKEG